MRALEELPDGLYCIELRGEYGNARHMINWDIICRVYACAIYVRPPDFSRRLLVVPGAVGARRGGAPAPQAGVARAVAYTSCARDGDADFYDRCSEGEE